MSTAPQLRLCWCGHPTLEPYSDEYRVCKACGTLVSTAPVDAKPPQAAQDNGEFYSKDYWHQHQTEHHKLPPLAERARLDLPERCAYWLKHLLERRLPPARVLDIGCAHGGYVALLNWAGFQASGTEMSPWVVDYARSNFGITVYEGPVEALALAPASFDVIVLNDVLEHLPDPVGTLTHCASLLGPDGFFIIQTPEYKEHLTYADLVRSSDLFLKHMDGNNREHLYLFSRRSTTLLFSRLGYPSLDFGNPVYSYDLFFCASRSALPVQAPEAIAASLRQRPEGRLVQALLDKAAESADRWWAIQRLEAELRRSKP